MGLRLVQRLGWGGQGLQLCGVKHLHCCLFLSNLVTNNTATIKPVQFMVILVMLQIRLINSQMCCHKYISNHLRGISVLLQIRPINSHVCCHKYIRSPYRYLSFVTNQASQLTGVLPQVHQITPWVSVLFQIRQTNLQVCCLHVYQISSWVLTFCYNSDQSTCRCVATPKSNWLMGM